MDNVTKIYELKSLGYAQLIDELGGVTTAFEDIKAAKQSLNDTKLNTGADAASLADLKNQTAQARLETAKLVLQKQQLTNEAKAAAVVQQQESQRLKEQKTNVEAAAGSYASLYKQYKDLYALVKSAPTGSAITFGGDTLQFDQAIAKLKELSAQEQAFRRQFTGDGVLIGEYTSGIVNAFKNLGLDDLIGGQITRSEARLNELKSGFGVLQTEFAEVKASGVGSFESIEAQMIANQEETIRLTAQLSTLQTEFRNAGNVGNQISESIGNGFKEMGKQLAQFVIGFIGFQALISGITNAIDLNKKLSDSFVDLQRFLHATDSELLTLIADIKNIPTRTPLDQLFDIATLAAKSGVAKDQIAQVTTTIDSLRVSMGQAAGPADTFVENMVKLADTFSPDKKPTAKNISDIGAAFLKLTSSGTVNADFLFTFAEKLGGINSVAGVSIQNILGIGSALDELGIKSKLASNAAQTLILEMFQKPAEFARITGQSIKDFTKDLTDAPITAFLNVADKLKDIKSAPADLVESFNQAGIKGNQLVGVLAEISSHSDLLKEKINQSNAAFGDQGSILDASAKKQNNFAATIDKITKSFQGLESSSVVQGIIVGVGTAISFLVGNLSPLLIALGAYGTLWSIANAQMIIAKATTLLTNIAFVAQYAVLTVGQLIVRSYTTAVQLLTAAFGEAAAASTFLGAAIKILAGPIGIVLAVIGLLSISFVAMGNAASAGVNALSDFARQAKIAAQINEQATNTIAEQKAVIDGWITVIKSASTSIDTKRFALQKLIDIDPAFRSALQGQAIDLNKLADAYKNVTDNILIKAKADAAGVLSAEKQKDVNNIAAFQEDLEIKQAVAASQKNQSVFTAQVTDEQIKLLKESSLRESGALVTIVGNEAQFFTSRFSQVQAFLQQKSKDAAKVYQDYITAQAKADADLANISNKGTVATTPAKKFEVDVSALKLQLDNLNKEIENYQGDLDGLNKLVAQRKALQDQYNKLTGNDKPAKLSAADKDAINKITAAQDAALAEEKLKYIQGQEDEETYLKNILAIDQKYGQQKINAIIGNNSDERKARAQFKLEIIQDEQDTNKKLFDLDSARLKQQLQDSINAANQQRNAVLANPIAGPQAKADAELNADQQILAAQVTFNTSMDALEKLRNQKSKQNSAERVAVLIADEKKVDEDLLKDALATLQQLDLNTQTEIAKIKAAGAQSIVGIQNNNSLTPNQKNTAITVQTNTTNLGTLGAEVQGLQQQLPIYQQLLAAKKITDQQYFDFVNNLATKEKQFQDLAKQGLQVGVQQVTTLKDLVTKGLTDLFNIDTTTAQGKLFVQTMQSIYSEASQIVSGFFAGAKQSIEQQKQFQLQVLDIQTKQAETHSQSVAETQAIDEQAQEKKDAINKVAFEKEKKLQIAQAEINLGSQLSNLAVIAFAPGPANLLSLGTAGIIEFAVLSALAFASFEQNVAKINSATYAGEKGMMISKLKYGGIPLKHGGPIHGPSHAHGGVKFNFEAEGGEMAIINKNATASNTPMTVHGTPMQIASAINEVGGGISFKPGAKKFDYGGLTKMPTKNYFDSGGYFGSSLPAPQFNFQDFGLSGGVSDQINQQNQILMAHASALNDVHDRIDRIEVVQVTSTVTNAQRKQVRQSQVATLGKRK